MGSETTKRFPKFLCRARTPSGRQVLGFPVLQPDGSYELCTCSYGECDEVDTEWIQVRQDSIEPVGEQEMIYGQT